MSMLRKVAGAVVGLAVGLGCSACGSTHTVRQSTTTIRTTTVAKVAPISLGSDLNFVILPPIHGAGDDTLGTFTVAGRYGYIAAKCTGQGPMKVAGLWTVPCEPAMGVDELGFDTPGQRIHLAVRAKPGTTWWLAVGEHIPRLVRAHRTLVLLHRSGVGSKSLGTFHLGARVTIGLTCTGQGAFNVFFRSTPPIRVPAGLETYCPEGNVSERLPAKSGVGISVETGRKVRWTITISETELATSAQR